METREAIAAAADIARITAFVEANRATECRRCKSKGVLDKRGLCIDCSEKRLATMRVPDAERNASSRETAGPPATTISSLLGNGGLPVCTSPVLDWCNQSMSARASMGEVFKKLGSLESFLILHPHNANAWDNYERRYAAVEAFVKAIQTAEDKIASHYPDLKREPIYIPERLERAAKSEWLSV